MGRPRPSRRWRATRCASPPTPRYLRKIVTSTFGRTPPPPPPAGEIRVRYGSNRVADDGWPESCPMEYLNARNLPGPLLAKYA